MRAWGVVCVTFLTAFLNSSHAQQQYAPTFRDISGVNQNDVNRANASLTDLWSTGLAWFRDTLFWDRYELEEGQFNSAYYQDFKSSIVEFQSQGVRFLPILAYNASWSWERTARIFNDNVYRYEITPRQDGLFDVLTFDLGTNDLVSSEVSPGGNTWPLAAEHVEAWEAFVTLVVTDLMAPPYNIEYFQVWNEPQPCSGFWFGDQDVFMKRVHLPAAEVIRSLGGKVVFAGYSPCSPAQEVYDLLDAHDAWNTIDVLSIHYAGVEGFKSMREASAARGRSNLSLWQTEVGSNPNPAFFGDFYPRFLYWALSNGWNNRDRFLSIYFALQSGDSPSDFGYGEMLYTGDSLSPHGRSLQAAANVFGVHPLEKYSHVESNLGLSPTIGAAESGMEAFLVGDDVVVAVHMQQGPIILTLSDLEPWQVESVERINAFGDVLDLTPMVSTGPGNTVVVSVPEVEEGALYGDFDFGYRIFYVRANTQPPGNVFSEVPQGGWVEEGQSWTFRAELGNSISPVTYQWMKNGIPIVGSPPSSTYTIGSVDMSHAGSYSCQITDGSAKAIFTTPTAELTVFPAGSLPLSRPCLLVPLFGIVLVGGILVLRRKLV